MNNHIWWIILFNTHFTTNKLTTLLSNFLLLIGQHGFLYNHNLIGYFIKIIHRRFFYTVLRYGASPKSYSECYPIFQQCVRAICNVSMWDFFEKRLSFQYLLGSFAMKVIIAGPTIQPISLAQLWARWVQLDSNYVWNIVQIWTTGC